jgi:MFS family permease
MTRRGLSHNDVWVRVRQLSSHLVTGGDWALVLPKKTWRNLSWFWYDGLFASASDNIILTYITLYVLAMGATRAQIGVMSALSNLSGAMLLLPGALLVERFHHRKEITILFSGGLARLAILALALIPFGISGQALVIIAIALSVTRDAFGNLAFPAWMSITADIVPIAGRGRYFGSRNFVMGIAGMVTVLLVGELITRLGQPEGYQLAMALAFVLGITSTFSFSRLHDPENITASQAQPSLAFPALLRNLRALPALPALIATAAVWNFFLNIPGPFFNVYMVQNLKASATMVGITGVVSTVSGLLVQRRLGRLADHWGAHRLQLISGLLIPILPFAWVFTSAPWHVIPINIVGGVLWGAYGLASFNLLLELTPQEGRARYSAIYQIIVTVALAAGAAVGGWMVTKWGYTAIFITSAIGRLIAALLFARFVRRLAPIQHSD